MSCFVHARPCGGAASPKDGALPRDPVQDLLPDFELHPALRARERPSTAGCRKVDSAGLGSDIR